MVGMLLVLLANGQGTRIATITRGRPKALLRVGRETLLGRHLRIAHSSMVVDHAICVVAPGHRAAFAAQVGHEVGHLPLRVSFLEDAPTAYAECVARVYSQIDEPIFFTVDADNVFPEEDEVAFFRDAPSRIDSDTRLVVGTVSYGVSDADPRIPSRLLTSGPHRAITRHEYVRGVGTYLWTTEAVRFAAHYVSRGGSSMRELIQRLCSRGELRAIPFTQAINVNTSGDYEEAQAFVASNAWPRAWSDRGDDGSPHGSDTARPR